MQHEQLVVVVVQINQQIHLIQVMHVQIVVAGNVIVDTIRMETLVQPVEQRNIVVHEQLVVVQQM